MHEQDVGMEDKKTTLALVIGRGQSVRAWARKNGVPERTAYRWSSEPEVRRLSETWRRHALNQTIGRMARRATAAADGIERLAKGAESESVRLRAWRAILADQMSVAKFSNLEQRMRELEEQEEQWKQQFGPQYGGK
jgi:transposase-like protein